MDTAKYNSGIYAILDTVAKQIQGGLYLYKHDASAIRFFSDVATMKDSIVGKHPQDFDLIRLGYLTHSNEVETEYRMVLKGSAWVATQTEHNSPEV